MAQFYDALDPRQIEFIGEQGLFFVATAPAAGRVNLSPKGLDTFRVLDPKTLVYLDLTGSGNETAAHLRENGRITVMFCSFGNKPMILRIYGAGAVIAPSHADWNALRPHFGDYPGVRQMVRIAVLGVQTSCGYAVPRYEFVSERDQLLRWAEKRGPEGIREYQRTTNVLSIDGLETGIEIPSAQ
ncbi:MAG: pyridoxamine 5'-phosphate oxidase family protein [Myxococcales bacterium]|nr:pyridoxamine 5'-phosphate oxidase family protein [Myxococcales bacterium]